MYILFLYCFVWFFFLVIYFVSLHKRDLDSVGSVFFLYSLLSFVPGFAASYRRCRHDCMTSPLSPQACWQTWSGVSSARIRYRLVSATDIELSKELLVFCRCPGQQSTVFVLVLLCYISTVFEDQLVFCFFSIIADHVIWQLFFFCLFLICVSQVLDRMLSSLQANRTEQQPGVTAQDKDQMVSRCELVWSLCLLESVHTASAQETQTRSHEKCLYLILDLHLFTRVHGQITTVYELLILQFYQRREKKSQSTVICVCTTAVNSSSGLTTFLWLIHRFLEMHWL